MKHIPWKETEAGFIQSYRDLVRLNIIDWNRYTSHWKNPLHAMEIVGGWVVGFRYSIVTTSLDEFPIHNDFPEWHHAGGPNHHGLGHDFWNCFQCVFKGEIFYHDQPEISGWVCHPDLTPGKRDFMGDIGLVSPISFLDSTKHMPYPDFWISARDESTLVFLEAPPKIANEGVILE